MSEEKQLCLINKVNYFHRTKNIIITYYLQLLQDLVIFLKIRPNPVSDYRRLKILKDFKIRLHHTGGEALEVIFFIINEIKQHHPK